MRPFSDKLILAWLSGGLDPPLARRLEEELRADPSLAARVEALRQRLLEEPEPPRWRLPPPGLPIGLGAGVSREALMEGTRLSPGDLLAVRLEIDASPPRIVVVLGRGESGWRVLSPEAPEEVVRVADLELDAQGGRILHLTVADAPARQVWAVALPLADPPVAFHAPAAERWAALLEGLDRGEVPVVSVEARLGEEVP